METIKIDNIKVFEEVASIPEEMILVIGDTLVFIDGKMVKISTRKLVEFCKDVLVGN